MAISRFAPQLVFAAAILVHLLINAPLEVLNKNTLMFQGVTAWDAVSAAWPIAVGAAAIYLLAQLWPWPVVRRLAGWMGLYLIIGFQFGLFVESKLLDGSAIHWFDFWPRMVAEYIVFLLGLFLILLLPAAYFHRVLYAGALFVGVNALFLLVSPASAQEDPFAGGSSPFSPFFGTHPADVAGMNFYSKERNVIVILIDMFQNDIAEELIGESPDIAAKLDGFTFYRNAAGEFPFTGLSLPVIHSGLTYKSGESLPEYLALANESRTERKLLAAGYDVNYLGLWARQPFAFGPEEARRIAKKQIANVLLYRQLPVVVKSIYFGSEPDFLGLAANIGEGGVGEQTVKNGGLDVAQMEKLTREAAATAERPQYKYVHLWGTHVPSTLSRDCEAIKPTVVREVYKDQAYCMLSLVTKYFDALKAIGVYDNSQIFVIADHGTTVFPIGEASDEGGLNWSVQSSAHPVMMFKDYGKSGALGFSDVAVSHRDLGPTILNGAGIEPKQPRDLTTANGPVERMFFNYELAAQMYDPTIATKGYSIGPNVRDRAGWETLD